MAAEAGFGRAPLPPPLSVDHDGYDINPKTPSYQMIPVGTNRVWKVRSRGRVAIAALDPGVAGLLPADLPQPGPFAIDLPLVFNDARPVERDIRIFGRNVGTTQIVAVDLDNNFAMLAFIAITVKSEATFTYNLLRLRDLRRPPVRTQAEIEIVAALVERLYLNQTNTKMIRLDSKEIFVKEDLGDPIDDPDQSANPGTERLQRAVLRMESDGLVAKADRHIISTWDVSDKSTRGFTPFVSKERFGRICIVEHLDGHLEEAKNMAHELGHTFQIRHELHSSTDLLMHDAPVGMRMLGIDIDRINKSGL